MKVSLYLYVILQGYLIVTAFNSYFDAIICVLSIILLPSPLPYLIKRYLQSRKNNNLKLLPIGKLLINKLKLSEDLYLAKALNGDRNTQDYCTKSCNLALKTTAAKDTDLLPCRIWILKMKIAFLFRYPILLCTQLFSAPQDRTKRDSLICLPFKQF